MIDGIGHIVMHPDMDASFCIYNLEQARSIMMNKSYGEYNELVTIWTDDIEEPTMMFEGDIR